MLTSSRRATRSSVLPAVAAPLLMAALLAGCASSSDDAAVSPTSAGITSAPPATDAPTTGESATAPPPSTDPDAPDYMAGAAEKGCVAGDTLDDGRWFGFVPDGGVNPDEETIDFDLACWFAGPEADAAGAARGEEVTNGYLVVNDNEHLRTVTASMTATVTFFPSGDPNDVMIVMLKDWIEARTDRGFEMGVWIEIDGGTVTKVEERWVP